MAAPRLDLRHLAIPGQEIALRATPRAARNALSQDDQGGLSASVTAPPEDGKANAAIQAMLAKAMGLAKTRLELIRGQTARDKVFRVR